MNEMNNPISYAEAPLENATPKLPMMGLAIASMVLGILSVVSSANMFFAVIALVFGIVAMNYGNKSVFSRVGVITGAVSVLLNLLVLVGAVAVSLIITAVQLITG